MNIKYFNDASGLWEDITGNIGDSLIIDADGWNTIAISKKYAVEMTQVSTSDPTIDVEYQNTIGTIVWSYVSNGVYNGFLTGAFAGGVPTQTRIFYNTSYSANSVTYTITKIDSDNIELNTKSQNEGSIDNLLKTTFVEILIY